MLQKRCMRLITNSPFNSHAAPLFSKLHQLTIFDLNKLLIATFMFRHHNHCLPGIFSNYFCTNSSIHDQFTRISSDLHITFARLDVRKLQLRTCGPKLWNSMDPALINNSRNWQIFKSRYKKQLLSKYV